MKVSALITAYNHEKYIAQALDGILMQEVDFDFEVVVGDDCSTDRTREIVLDYARRHPGVIRTVFPERNLGDGGKPMLVETVRACRGEYVAMMDGDDYWTAPYKLRRQAEFLDAHPECSLCHHDVRVVAEEGAEPPDRSGSRPPAFATLEDLLHDNFVQSPTPMIRREAIAEFPAWYYASPWGDYPLYVMAAEKGLLGYIDEPMAVYRVHPGGIWSGLDRLARAKSVVEFYETLEPGIRVRHARTLSRIVARRLYGVARAHAELGEVGPTARALWTALRRDPRASQVGHLRMARMLIRACRTAVSPPLREA